MNKTIAINLAVFTLVSAGRYDQAIDRAERAQTTLLDAKQAGDETAPAAMNALKDAARYILDKKKTTAIEELDKAARTENLKSLIPPRPAAAEGLAAGRTARSPSRPCRRRLYSPWCPCRSAAW